MCINIAQLRLKVMADDKKITEMKQQIASYLRKKDHYDILGIPKTADEAEIKKAYKKLALRFHPDKNSVQGAKEVFKKVSNAYSTLTDKDKRDHYDRFGPEQDLPPRRQYQYQQADQQFDEFDQIFRQFFGGVPRRGRNMHYQTFHFGGGAGAGGAAAGQRQQQNTFSMAYMFIFIIGFMILSSFFESKPTYSMNPSSEYRYRAKTHILNVDYYVNDEYSKNLKANPNSKVEIDKWVDREYIVQLQRTCTYNKNARSNLQYQAYQYRDATYRNRYLEQAKKIDLTYCKVLEAIIDTHQQYYYELKKMKV